MASAASRSRNKKKAQKQIDIRPRPDRFSTSRQWIFLLGLLVCATLLLYFPASHHPFLNVDDNDYVTENVHVKAGLDVETFTWAFTTYDAANWHPLTWLSHALDCQLFQLDPAGHHTTNLLLHALNVALLFWVLWRATGYPGRSLMVAALFALHPINVESVAWIAERKNLLSMLFFLLTLGAYRWYALRPRLGRYGIVMLLYVFGLMSKPQVITLPFVLLLWDYWPLWRMAVRDQELTEERAPPPISPQRSFLWLVKEKVPLFALSAASAVITMRAQSLGGGTNTVVSFPSRLANAVVAYGRYLLQAFWPAQLAPFYPHPGASLRVSAIAMSMALLVAITAVVLVARRRRYLLVGWFWFLGTLVPMIGLMQVGWQAMADRYAYLPFVGLFIMICWGVADWATQRKVALRWQAALGGAVLLPLLVLTHRQIDFWADNVRLWTHTLQVTSGNYLAEDNLGRALEAEGKRPEALSHYERAAEIEPSYVFAHVHAGTCNQLEGDAQGALHQYQKVIDLTQSDIAHYAEVRHLIFDNMAAAYGALGDWIRARQCLESALSLNPDNPEEWMNLGMVAQRTGDLDRAIAAYSHAVKLQPTQRGFQLLASALQQAGRQQEAQAALQQAMALSGDTESAPR